MHSRHFRHRQAPLRKVVPRRSLPLALALALPLAPPAALDSQSAQPAQPEPPQRQNPGAELGARLPAHY